MLLSELCMKGIHCSLVFLNPVQAANSETSV